MHDSTYEPAVERFHHRSVVPNLLHSATNEREPSAWKTQEQVCRSTSSLLPPVDTPVGELAPVHAEQLPGSCNCRDTCTERGKAWKEAAVDGSDTSGGVEVEECMLVSPRLWKRPEWVTGELQRKKREGSTRE